MITEFLGAVIAFEARLRADAEIGGASADLEIEISPTTDAPFVQKTQIWCITENDIDEMIEELKRCKSSIRKWNAAAQKIERAKSQLK